jgi:hypothetical protein
MQTRRRDITGNGTYEIQGTVCVVSEQIKIRLCLATSRGKSKHGENEKWNAHKMLKSQRKDCLRGLTVDERIILKCI